jgi:ATP-dependent Clp protease ATP-binding subunit ClpA
MERSLAMHRTPHGVLLLDEIEKAHPDVFDLLLQIMAYGKLTDDNGRQADFPNRLDARISFAPLSLPLMERIVERMVGELAALLATKSVALELSDEARAYLAKKGLDPLNGARPLSRIIQEEIERPLSEELLLGRLADGGSVTEKAEGRGWRSAAAR